jgi:hypothetical protein
LIWPIQVLAVVIDSGFKNALLRLLALKSLTKHQNGNKISTNARKAVKSNIGFWLEKEWIEILWQDDGTLSSSIQHQKSGKVAGSAR